MTTMIMYPSRLVVQNLAVAQLVPQVMIVIAVDTAYVASQANGFITSGVYMIDNMVRRGSTNEGTLDLSTICSVGNLIGFHSVPINAAGSSGDQVVITAFATIQGNVFTGAGHPIPQPPFGFEPQGSYWIGQAIRAGTETYQIQIKVTVGQLQPVSVFVQWPSAQITAS
jgi:hypothetical protein